LAEVENQSMRQRLQVAEQQYVDAVTDLRRQIGLPEYAAPTVPAGPLAVPEDAMSADEGQLTQIALAGHPDIQVAIAQANLSHAAVDLARAERIPLTSVGPLYEIDESGTTFYGLAVNAPVPILNSGRRLVCQRETEYHRDLVAAEQTRVRITAAVKASLAKWLQTEQLVAEVEGTAAAIEAQTQKMERLYAAGQTDLLKLLQVRQRLIDAENAKLDMLWQATQAYADLLAATGATPLLAAQPILPNQPEAGAERPPE
jgi:cobalt-zinc-cadmium efflux system outer membrane protein